MRFLLSTLTSLSIFGGAATPLVVKSSTAKTTESVKPLADKQKRIDLGGVQKISTNQGRKFWSIRFAFDLEPGEKIQTLRFEGGGLHSYVGWGGDHWERHWNYIDTDETQPWQTIFDEKHQDFLATQWASLHMGILTRQSGPNNCELSFEYYTESLNSFNGSWGTLTLGSAITVVAGR